MSFECRSTCDGRLIKKLKNSNYRDTKSGHYKASIWLYSRYETFQRYAKILSRFLSRWILCIEIKNVLKIWQQGKLRWCEGVVDNINADKVPYLWPRNTHYYFAKIIGTLGGTYINDEIGFWWPNV